MIQTADFVVMEAVAGLGSRVSANFVVIGVSQGVHFDNIGARIDSTLFHPSENDNIGVETKISQPSSHPAGLGEAPDRA